MQESERLPGHESGSLVRVRSHQLVVSAYQLGACHAASLHKPRAVHNARCVSTPMITSENLNLSFRRDRPREPGGRSTVCPLFLLLQLLTVLRLIVPRLEKPRCGDIFAISDRPDPFLELHPCSQSSLGGQSARDKPLRFHIWFARGPARLLGPRTPLRQIPRGRAPSLPRPT